MTTPNDTPNPHNDPAQPPYNPKPGLWSSVPRTVLIGGASAVAVVVLVVVIALTGKSVDDSASAGETAAGTSGAATTSAVAFVPNLLSAKFGDGWLDKKTNEAVTPPQRIRITGSLDLTEAAEAIGYGANEQRLPKNTKYAFTDSSFPVNNQSVRMYTGSDSALHLSWNCEFVPNHPDGEDCQEVYRVSFDVSGSEPAVAGAANSTRELPVGSRTSVDIQKVHVVVANPSELPESALGRDKATGAETVFLLAATQPRESSAKVYFVVPDSLELYVGELESSR